MLMLIKKTGHYFLKGHLRGLMYDRLFVQFLPRMKGFLSLFFYRLLYKHFSFGKNILAWGPVILTKSPESVIRIGNDVRLVSDPVRSSIGLYSRCKFQAFFGARITVGNRVGLNGTAITCRTTSVEIDDGTIIAPNVIIVDSAFHAPWPTENRMHNKGYENDRPVKIGRNVWIATNCTILKGVTIGDNSIIAAGSVVIGNIPANTVAGGVPARVLKPLSP